MRFKKIYFLILNFIFLSGCIQSTALLGPGVTIATSGNIMQAGLQFGANSAIKKETGKDAITFVKDKVEEDKKKRKFKKDFSVMVKKRIESAREKIYAN
tara:strand:+ start:189 stop:485 length:297 start_codon:yes stop_codon:yes gene_type:complete